MKFKDLKQFDVFVLRKDKKHPKQRYHLSVRASDGRRTGSYVRCGVILDVFISPDEEVFKCKERG